MVEMIKENQKLSVAHIMNQPIKGSNKSKDSETGMTPESAELQKGQEPENSTFDLEFSFELDRAKLETAKQQLHDSMKRSSDFVGALVRLGILATLAAFIHARSQEYPSDAFYGQSLFVFSVFHLACFGSENHWLCGFRDNGVKSYSISVV
ncbi:hypothetical protein GS646_07220 [Ruegeria sp. HKCCD4315]|uniref:hypothetical protein n=2 Tax=Ruegeria TaxID=97050 RepID=UPI0014928F46|nr:MULTISPECIES: hypothetical protein [unclassified Ruegeria]NOD87530.1 hypothetical protein [Ruegeria sp. HKCCD4318]NOE13085.1 hypothetical protein [Ruegeria sp. HKCCD4318-2]NOG08747.1 hypothetical protein [Ruegeria sp. HKCCD4315]